MRDHFLFGALMTFIIGIMGITTYFSYKYYVDKQRDDCLLDLSKQEDADQTKYFNMICKHFNKPPGCSITPGMAFKFMSDKCKG